VNGLTIKFQYDGAWNAGRIHIETDTLEELTKTIRKLNENTNLGQSGSRGSEPYVNTGVEYPSIPGNLGCADSIRAILGTEYGRKEPRTESELTAAMKANALHFPHGTIAGLLNALTKRGELRRVGKKNGAYAYTISKVSVKSDHEALVIRA
jgi:hypothetical protein